jgi:YVTN family beta-propeller protein
MCITDARARVFVAGGGDSYVAAFDGKSDRRVGMWTSWSYTMAVHADAVADKLYCLSYPSQVIVVDPATNRRVAGIAVADYPVAVCFNTVDRKVYVACESEEGGALEVLDGVGDSLLTEVDVEGTPTLLAFNPSDDILYAADPSSYWIQAISGKTDSVLDYVLVPERPVGLVYNEAQDKLYSFGPDGVVAVIKPDLSGVICRIRIAAGLSLFALNSAGTRLYCGNYDLTLVYVIDCVQDRLACAVPVVAPLASLCCSSNDNVLYCGSYSDELSVIDRAKNCLVDTIPVAAQFIYADSATDAIYCLSGRDLAVVDGETRTVMRTFDLGTHASALASAAGWQYVYLADEGDPYLLLVRKASGPTEMAVQATPDAQATVVRGRLDWAGTLAVMYDMGGRRVADVHRGGNDVSRLRPGVYFVLQNGVRRGTYARKVVIAN